MMSFHLLDMGWELLKYNHKSLEIELAETNKGCGVCLEKLLGKEPDMLLHMCIHHLQALYEKVFIRWSNEDLNHPVFLSTP